MLETLRKLPPDAKKKVALLIAGLITLLILIGWALRSSSVFGRTYEAAREQGIAIFAFFDQNVGEVYMAFQEKLPQVEEAVSESGATTTIDKSEAQNPNFETNPENSNFEN